MQICRNTKSLLLLALMLLGAPIYSTAGEQQPDSDSHARILNLDSPNRVPGRFIVVFKDDETLARDLPRYSNAGMLALPNLVPNTAASLDSLSRALAECVGGKLLRVIPGTRNGSLKGFVVQMSDDQLNKLAGDPRIKYIEAVLTVSVNSTQTLPTNNSLWHLDRVDQPFLPLNRIYSYFTGGVGVNLAVMDTGILASHDDFAGRLSLNQWDCTTIVSSELGCETYGEFVPLPENWDCNGHGTHVASLAGGSKYGVAKGVTFRIFKVIVNCDGTGSSEHVVYALSELLTHPDLTRTVLVLSLTVDGVFITLEDWIGEAIDEGVTVVSSSGNTNSLACNKTPARMSAFSSVITVGASTISDGRWLSSDFGECITLFAPGENITGAWKGSDTDEEERSGSSQAAPIVAGIAALYKNGLFIDAPPANVKETIVAEAIDGELTGVGTGSPNKLANSHVPNNNNYFSSTFAPVLIYQTVIR